jgi:hypothetical protein
VKNSYLCLQNLAALGLSGASLNGINWETTRIIVFGVETRLNRVTAFKIALVELAAAGHASA